MPQGRAQFAQEGNSAFNMAFRVTAVKGPVKGFGKNVTRISRLPYSDLRIDADALSL